MEEFTKITATVIKKGRKYLHVQRDGSTYTFKVVINEMSSKYAVGDRIEDLDCIVDKTVSRYGTTSTATPITPTMSEELDHQRKNSEINRWKSYVESKFQENYIYNRGLEELRKLGFDTAIFDKEIHRIQREKKEASIIRWSSFCAEAAQDGRDYEKGYATLFELGASDRVAEFRKIARDARTRKRKQEQQTEPDWIDYNFSAPNWSGTDLTHLQVGDHYYDQKADQFYILVTRNYTYIEEDGMSFGLADDSGCQIFGKARPATAAESLPWRKERLREAAIAKLKAEYKSERNALETHIRENGDRPEHKAGELLASTVSIHGSGSWFEVGNDYIWFCLNNGMDGDDWSRNNVSTWGAGAIGWRIPYDRSIAARIKRIDSILKSDFEVPEQFTLEELQAGAEIHERGGNVDPELIFQAHQAGLISSSSAMNSDF